MTLGGVRHDVRDLAQTVRELEDSVARLQGGEGVWKGNERRTDDAVFSDRQTDKINELIEVRAAFFRLILWALGAFASLAATILFAYLKLKS